MDGRRARARPLRIAFRGAEYPVTARGNERRARFLGTVDDDGTLFLEGLEQTRARFNGVCPAYGLMALSPKACAR